MISFTSVENFFEECATGIEFVYEGKWYLIEFDDPFSGIGKVRIHLQDEDGSEYLDEYEQEGCDRAKYGARLLDNLADKLSIKGLDRSTLNVCRLFYTRYPQICATVSHKLQKIDYFPKSLAFMEKKLGSAICETVSRKFETPPAYKLQLPDREQLENFLIKEVKEMGL